VFIILCALEHSTHLLQVALIQERVMKRDIFRESERDREMIMGYYLIITDLLIVAKSFRLY